jgi:hypothetical protein
MMIKATKNTLLRSDPPCLGSVDAVSRPWWRVGKPRASLPKGRWDAVSRPLVEGRETQDGS